MAEPDTWKAVERDIFLRALLAIATGEGDPVQIARAVLLNSPIPIGSQTPIRIPIKL